MLVRYGFHDDQNAQPLDFVNAAMLAGRPRMLAVDHPSSESSVLESSAIMFRNESKRAYPDCPKLLRL
jgi:hypothetical protein